MPWEMIKEMSDFGMTISSHSISHPYLAREYPYRGDAWLMSQLSDSKKQIEDITGKECYAFAYPFGSRDEHVADAVRKAGYKCACDASDGGWQSSDRIFNLKRVSMGTEIPLNVMYRRLQW